MTAPTVVWISSTDQSRQHFADLNLHGDFNLKFLDDAAAVWTALDGEPIDCVVIDGPMSEADRIEYLEAICSRRPATPEVFWDSEMSAGQAARLVRAGAFECIGHRDGLDAPHDVLSRAIDRVQSGCRKSREPWREILLGHSRAVEEVVETIRQVGPRRCNILITGESGTGKEVATRAIHAASPRRNQPLVAVNCAALPENLLEAELFGHVKGAFTGAANVRIGRFEQANKGTIFLDEIGDMPIELQAKLLRVIQEREIQRLGSSDTISIDVRLIAATNVNLLERIKQGKFREDLYYRLNVVPIEMPPLRKRTEDIPELVHHFIRKICSMEGIPGRQVAAEAMNRLKACAWPGNVRQLENAVEMALALSGENPTLTAADFRLPNATAGKLTYRQTLPFEACEETGDFDSAVNHFERTMIEKALSKASGNKTAAAEMLGLKRTTLIMKLRGFEQAAVQVR